MNQKSLLGFEDRVEDLLSRMTLREKIGQLNQAVPPKTPEQAEIMKEKVRRGEIGSFILAATSTAGNDDNQPLVKVEENEMFQHIAVEESRLGIPLIYGRDVIHGHHTVFPLALASACSFNPELVKKCYAAIAREAAAEGIHWTFSPMVDIAHDPRWGRMVEGTGEDPFMGEWFAKAAVEGFQGEDLSSPEHIAACAKHFLGYGFSEAGRDYTHTEISDYTLYNMVLPAFRAAVDAGVATVMSSFNDINSVPVAGTKKYLTKILRGQLGFEGFVISDWGAIRQMIREGICSDLSECAALALPAGMDMDMDCSCYADNMLKLVESGRVSEEEINTAVRRILRVKFAVGLFDHPFLADLKVDKAAHLALSREIAGESMILLKNKNNVLPLKKNATITLAGPFTNEKRSLLGTWTLDRNLDNVTDFATAMDEVTGASGGSLEVVPNDFLYDAAPEAFFRSKGDVIVLALGESYRVSGEIHCVADTDISDAQVELAKKAYASGKKVVGVLFTGRPLALEKIEPYLDAILCAWHSGSEAAHAACDILFGDVNPSGKTSVTFLRRTVHAPLFYNQYAPAKAISSYYGNGSGYLDGAASPLYPFGFGLSYTDFEISPVTVRKGEIALDAVKAGEKFELSVKLKNVGARAGKETVELYIRDMFSSYIRPLRELKGFRKIGLEPGEEKEVVFELGAKELGFYDEDGGFLLEKGKFKVYIGEDSLTNNEATITIL